ncbi:hypothetical protein ABL57_05675 [Kocuria sp. SM24M-10]|nr:hypothetical protein ABL57_05675 [Kocuria sp. SM24M-10]
MVYVTTGLKSPSTSVVLRTPSTGFFRRRSWPFSSCGVIPGMSSRSSRTMSHSWATVPSCVVVVPLL